MTDLHDAADVLVVGSGPAGSMTALLLARRGVPVILVDREDFPRSKPCGDCLSAAATDLLRRHDLLGRVAAAPHAWLDGWSVASPAGHVSTGRFERGAALAIERRVLDHRLRQAALDAGARPLRGRVVDLLRRPGDGRVAGVRIRGPAGELRVGARLAVGADGLRSIVARRLDAVRRRPRLRKVSLTSHVRSAVSGGAGEAPGRFGRMYVLAGGCVGVAPVGGGRLNVTAVLDDAKRRRLADLGPRTFLQEWLSEVPGLLEAHPALDGDGAGLGEILASGPFDWPSRGPVSAGAALVGDAAGYYDPFTGQGIYQAMAGAEALAEAVGEVLVRRPAAGQNDLDAALSRYASVHRRLTRPARRLQGVIEAVLSRPRLADGVLHRLARAPAVMNRLIEVTGDLRPPRGLVTPALLASFAFPSRTEAS